MEWHGLPPEANTGRLIAGAGDEPYLSATAGWQAVADEFTAAMTALRAEISIVAATWQGMTATRAQAAFEPYLAWMASVIAMAEARSGLAAAQGTTYGLAVAETPSLGEIAANHTTHATLQATNFLGVNTVPIGVNEFEYLVVLWNRAAGAMDAYLASTGVNTAFPPFSPAPSVMAAPGAPEGGLAAILAATAAQLPQSMARDAILAELQVAGTEGAVRGQTQEVAQLAATASNLAGSQASEQAGQQATQDASQMAQAPQMAMQMVQQVPQQVGQMGQQVGQVPQQLMQSATQPLQQITQLFQGMGQGDLANQNITPASLVSHFGNVDQLGAYGTSAVGSSGGGYGGAGLLSSANSGGASALRAPAGWSQPAPAAGAEQVTRTTAVPAAGSSAVGSGTGVMGPMSGMHARAEGSTITVSEPVAHEKPVVASLGFEVFDE